jgi:aromatic-L-amino-acid/L-tryptophan decarboxylase
VAGYWHVEPRAGRILPRGPASRPSSARSRGSRDRRAVWKDPREVRSLVLDQTRLDRLAGDVLEAALAWTASLDERPIRPRANGLDLRDSFADALPEAGLGEDALDFAALFHGARAQNGRFLAYVMGSAEPVGVVGELLAAALNQNVTSWRSGPAAATIERALVDGLARELGCDGFAGSFGARRTSPALAGGSCTRRARFTCPSRRRSRCSGSGGRTYD